MPLPQLPRWVEIGLWRPHPSEVSLTHGELSNACGQSRSRSWRMSSAAGTPCPIRLEITGQGSAQLAGASLSCVLVSKSPASWRSCNWLDGSPVVRLTMRPRFTAGRSRSASAQRWTFL